MQQAHRKLFIGQHFIYTLRVLEYYLRMMTQDFRLTESLVEGSLAASHELGDEESWCACDRQWFDILDKQLVGHRGTRDGIVSPRTSVEFSSVKLSTVMGVQDATLNHYLQVFSKKCDTIYQSELAKLAGAAGEGLDRAHEAWMRTRERMSSLPYRVNDATTTCNLGRLVRYIIKDSGSFDGLSMFYYLFFRWHRIDYAQLHQLQQEGVELSYRDELLNILKLLEERRLGFDAEEVAVLLHEYFEYYALFISDADVIAALDYSYYSCNGYNSPQRTRRLLYDLFSVHRAFYCLENGALARGGKHKTIGKKPRCLSAGRDVWVSECPRIPDRTPFAQAPSWAGSFENAFASVVERKIRADESLASLGALAGESGAPFDQSQLEDIKLLLETANMIPRKVQRYNSSVHNYDAIDEGRFANCDGLNFAVPYYALIDSTPDEPLRHGNFVFCADATHEVPPLEVGPFKPLLEQFFRDSLYRAMDAGYPGISEHKIYLYDAERLDASGAAHSPRYLFRAGKSDYFTGIARKDLFARFLVPSTGNLQRPLIYLLERGTLPELIPFTLARRTQERYASDELAGLPSTVRLAQLFEDDPATERELTQLLRHEINRLYATLIDQSARRSAEGVPQFEDSGSAYTGCGTFVLTSDVDSRGNDRPFLLMERRWMVSEENDNLSYPSGGSCDFYSPDDNVPLDEESLKDLEADPFKTAARELREELNVLIEPSELALISFGIDVNRNLQQFSFLYESPWPAKRILARKRYATTPREGLTFAVPFHRQALCDILNNYQMESGAVYSLMRLMTLRKERLWP
jgi:hypothetical protein